MEKLVKFCEKMLFEPYDIVRQKLTEEFPGRKTSVVSEGLTVIVSVDDKTVVIGRQHNIEPQPEPHVFIREIKEVSMPKLDPVDNSISKTVIFDFYLEPCDNLKAIVTDDDFCLKVGRQFVEAFKRYGS